MQTEQQTFVTLTYAARRDNLTMMTGVGVAHKLPKTNKQRIHKTETQQIFDNVTQLKLFTSSLPAQASEPFFFPTLCLRWS